MLINSYSMAKHLKIHVEVCIRKILRILHCDVPCDYERRWTYISILISVRSLINFNRVLRPELKSKHDLHMGRQFLHR